MVPQLPRSVQMLSRILQCAEIFAGRLPQSQVIIDGKTVVLSFTVDQQPPVDTSLYQKRYIDSYATAAFRGIFSGEDEIDLLLTDIRLAFSVLFWDGRRMTAIEFTYPMNELIYLVERESLLLSL